MQSEIDRRHQLHIICLTHFALNEFNHKIFFMESLHDTEDIYRILNGHIPSH